jgi:hypothetical protein
LSSSIALESIPKARPAPGVPPCSTAIWYESISPQAKLIVSEIICSNFTFRNHKPQTNNIMWRYRSETHLKWNAYFAQELASAGKSARIAEIVRSQELISPIDLLTKSTKEIQEHQLTPAKTKVWSILHLIEETKKRSW